MQQQISQNASQTPLIGLTIEQEKILAVLKERTQFRPLYACAQICLGLIQISLTQIIQNHRQEGFAVFISMIALMQIYTAWQDWINLTKFQKGVKELLYCNDPAVAGVLTKAVMIGKSEDRVRCVGVLIPLLYRLNNRQAADAFTPEHREILRQIASWGYWRKREPDLAAAAMVALVALDDSKSKLVLEKLSARSWKHSEAWVGKAARLCLKQWGTRWETPPTVKPSTPLPSSGGPTPRP
jgi:hypothetical protein